MRALDEWALPGVEDPAATLAAMSERMKPARTPFEVGVTLAEAIERALQAPARAYLCVDGALVPAGGGEAALPVESAIPALMEGAREPAVVSGTHRRSYYSLLLDDRPRVDRRAPGRDGGAGRAGTGRQRAGRDSSPSAAAATPSGSPKTTVRFVRAAAASASLACDAIASEGLRADAGSADGLDEVALQCLRCGGVQGWAKDAVLCPCGGRLGAGGAAEAGARALRSERVARRRRHGRGVSRARPDARPRRGAQDAAATVRPTRPNG